MNEALDYFFLGTYFGGLIWIIVGIILIRFTIKNPQESKFSVIQGDMRGWAGGLGFIGVGISIIVMKLLGKI